MVLVRSNKTPSAMSTSLPPSNTQQPPPLPPPPPLQPSSSSAASTAASTPTSHDGPDAQGTVINSSEKIGPFNLMETLGEGSTGKVKLAVHRTNGKKVAIKIINKSILSDRPSLKRKVEREISVMKLISHPHVIRLFDVLQTKKYLFLIIEYAEGGELFDYIVQKGRLSVEEAFHFFKQIILGIEYCHNNLICHRDLKPENLLLDDTNSIIKIADFGMASMMSEDTLLETSCGSPHYASPEVVKGEKYNGMEADIWSCGVILYALLTGSLPFDDDNTHTLLTKVRIGRYTLPDFLDKNVKDLISRMLQVNPSKRIKISQIKLHPWWKKMNMQLKSNEKATLAHEMKKQQLEQRADESHQAVQIKKKQQQQQQPASSSTAQQEGNTVMSPSEEQSPTATSDTSDETSSTFSDASIKNLPADKIAVLPDVMDQRIIDAIKSMGWSDEESLKTSLESPVKNLETVLYRLLEKQLIETGKISLPESYVPSLSVSLTNPIRDDVDSVSVLRQRLTEMSLSEQTLESRGGKEREKPASGRASSATPWFAFWKKKPKNVKKQQDENSRFGIHSNKTQQEIVAELSRSFNVLHITWERYNVSTIRAKFHHADNPVEFDISMTTVPKMSGFLLSFSRVSGNISAARVLFDVLQEELSL